MFVDELRVPISAEQNAEVIEPRDYSLEFDTVYKKNRQWDFVFANVIEKAVLEAWGFFCRHCYVFRFFLLMSATWISAIVELRIVAS